MTVKFASVETNVIQNGNICVHSVYEFQLSGCVGVVAVNAASPSSGELNPTCCGGLIQEPFCIKKIKISII